jgi:starch synthase (maltosyl-transferring)
MLRQEVAGFFCDSLRNDFLALEIVFFSLMAYGYIVVVVVSALFLASPEGKAMKQAEKMLIYNLFPTLAGPLPDWQHHLTRAADMGFTWIFVNPIHGTGKSGSLYSIKDYFKINPLLLAVTSEMSDRDQVREMTRAAGNLGLKVMVDLVISHCAVDSTLPAEHPAWFAWEAPDRVAHPFAFEGSKKVVWRDLAKFDYKNSKDRKGLFAYMLEVVKFLMDLGFKGFRCDAAYQVPRRVWERLIKEARKVERGVLFFAETLGCQPDQTRKTASAGFDYIFNSSKWWDFRSRWLMAQYQLTREVAPSISFPDSHDTARLFDELGGNLEGVKQRYLFAALFSAGVMMLVGFEFGFRRRLHVVKTRPEDWEDTDIDLTAYIAKVNNIKKSHPVFQEEAPTELLAHGNSNILFMWKGSVKTEEEALLILNADIHHHEHFHVDNLQDYVQAGLPLTDVSPEYPLDFLPVPFDYDLRPGQGIVLVTSRDAVPED